MPKVVKKQFVSEGNEWVEVPIGGGSAPPQALDDLTDVTVLAPAVGDTLVYDGAGWVSGNMRFADAAERDAAIPIPEDGQKVFVQDISMEQIWLGSAWCPVGGRVPYLTLTYAATTSIAGANFLVPNGLYGRGFDLVTGTTQYEGLYSISGTISHALNGTGGYVIPGIRSTGVFVAQPYGAGGLGGSASPFTGIVHLALSAVPSLELNCSGAVAISGASVTFSWHAPS